MGDWTFFCIVVSIGALAIWAIVRLALDGEIARNKQVALHPDIAQAIAEAEKRLALSYNVDDAIARAERLLRVMREGDEEVSE